MVIEIEAYNRLKHDIVIKCSNCSRETFQLIKRKYENDINSARCWDNIKDLKGLITVLEKRNALNRKDVCKLIEIAKYTGHSDAFVEFYTKPEPFPEIQPFHASGNHNNNSNNNTVGNTHYSPVFNNEPVTDQVFDYIVNHIGHSWKDLARNLGISEGKIDELEERYKYDVSERVRQILLYHKRRDFKSWHSLLEALNKCRRNDMRLHILQIIDK